MYHILTVVDVCRHQPCTLTGLEDLRMPAVPSLFPRTPHLCSFVFPGHCWLAGLSVKDSATAIQAPSCWLGVKLL